MKLCITSTGKEMESKIDETFGRAPYFLLIDTDTGAMDVIENPAATQGQGAGIAAAQIAADNGADAVLTGYAGQNAFHAFQASGIKLFVGASAQNTINEAFAKFKQGEYSEASAPQEEPFCGPGRGRGLGRGRGRGRGRCRSV
jgi:predicted Fe-Mo cluster-binding NifX family protein